MIKVIFMLLWATVILGVLGTLVAFWGWGPVGILMLFALMILSGKRERGN